MLFSFYSVVFAGFSADALASRIIDGKYNLGIMSLATACSSIGRCVGWSVCMLVCLSKHVNNTLCAQKSWYFLAIPSKICVDECFLFYRNLLCVLLDPFRAGSKEL